MNEKDLETKDLQSFSENKTETPQNIEDPDSTEFAPTKNLIKNEFLPDDFKVDLTATVSSPTRKPMVKLPINNEKVSPTLTKPETIQSEIFKELAAPRLPELLRENRAHLQMQSPTKVFFYWSLGGNPFETLRRALGAQAANYTLVAKLKNFRQNKEEVFPVTASGSAWFDVEAGASYRAEIGFFAPGKPFIRLIFSNMVEMPRSNPSPQRDLSVKWAVTASQFAEALDVSGYAQDAFEVALAGDDVKFADQTTQNTFSQLVGEQAVDSTVFNAGEMRLALLSLASGASLENLRGEISKNLFAQFESILRARPANLKAEKILAVLEENFGVNFARAQSETGEETKRRFSSIVFGKSLINFPKFSPVSSLRVTESYR